MTKVVYNACFGGFGLSKKAIEMLAEMGHKEAKQTIESGVMYLDPRCRHDSMLVEVVEKLGEEANGRYADLRVIVLQGNKYKIDEYDGNESVLYPENMDWVTVK